MYDSSRTAALRKVSMLEDYAATCYSLENNLSEAKSALEEEVRKNSQLKEKLEHVKVRNYETRPWQRLKLLLQTDHNAHLARLEDEITRLQTELSEKKHIIVALRKNSQGMCCCILRKFWLTQSIR